MPSSGLQAGPVTLYAQLAGILRDSIISGLWKNGEEIPTLEQLAKQYDVARVTVRQAVQTLSAEGLLSSHRGRRTFVTYAQPTLDMIPLYSSIGSVNTNPDNYVVEVVGKERFETLPTPLINRGAPTGRYVRIRKLDSESGVVYAVSDNYVAADLFAKLPSRLFKKAKISRLIRDHADPPIASAFERITVSLLNYDEARLMKVAIGSPAARVARVFLNAKNEILYYGLFAYRADRFGVERDISEFLRRPRRS
jgi:GntR family transcriptional regulator